MARARVVPVAFALLAIALSAQKLATAAPHPHFNDRGTLSWYTSLAEAQSVARETGRLIFIDSGRLECGNCRKLIGSILPQEPIRSRIGAIAIGLSDDCDNPDPAVAAILEANVPGAAVLPIVGFVTPELRWVTGWSGGTTPAAVLQQVSIAEERFRKVQSVMAARRAPAPQAAAPQAAAPQIPAAQPAPLAAQSAPRSVSPAAPTPAPVAAPKEVASQASPTTPSPLAASDSVKAPATAQAPALTQMPETKPEPLALSSPKPAAAPKVADPVATPRLIDNTAPAAIASAPSTSASGNRPSSLGAPGTAIPQTVMSSPTALGSAGGAGSAGTTGPSAAITGLAPLAATSNANASKSTTATKSKTTTQAGSTPVLARARTAAADQAWGDLVRLGETLPATDTGSDAYEVRMLVQSAYTWTLDSLSTAQTAAAERRYDDALRTLEVVRRELDGTTCPAVRDAERGRRAVERLRDIERGSPDQADAPEADRRVAYAEFRGSRWACLFRKK